MTYAPAGRVSLARAAVWLAICLPALYQLGLIAITIAGRVGYPYDLEWMEGGMLHHAQRIRDGAGIYVPPSVDFIPYLYTPLYPAILALLGGAVGLTYTLGRMISVLSLLGISIVSALQLSRQRDEHAALGPGLAGALLGLGLFAAAYPTTDGWYDLVRADTLFLFMITGAIAGLPRWSRAGAGLAGHGRVAAGAALLALAFFCKQTGIFYVALGGLIVLVRGWRRVPIYVATAGAIGLGGAWLLERTTGGWFWTYASEIHRAHDFNMDRVWKSFENILWRPELNGVKYPPLGAAISIAVLAGLLVVGFTYLRCRRRPAPVGPFLLWTVTYAVSTVVGAIGWGTEFAHWNAYMPAFLHGALAAGAAVPAIYACVRLLAMSWRAPRRPTRYHRAATPIGLPEPIDPRTIRPTRIAFGASLAVALVLSAACVIARWRPAAFLPAPEDAAAGDRLIARIKQLEGEVWMPSHPWYLHLAGKTPYTHRMGILDVTWRQTRVVEGLAPALTRRAFSALVLDEPDVHVREVPSVGYTYRKVFQLPRDEQPRLWSGARARPASIWMPTASATPPPGARAVFNFEAAAWDGWTRSGDAWGDGPVTLPLPGQELVFGATGDRFGSSMHGGDRSVGRLTSPEFVIEGARLTMRLGGTANDHLRVELWAEDTEKNPNGAPDVIATAVVLQPGGEALREVTLDVTRLRGKPARLVLVDDSESGHLVIDDVWLWP